MKVNFYVICLFLGVIANALMLYISDIKDWLKDTKAEAEIQDVKEVKFTPEQQQFVDKIVNKKYSSWKQETESKYGDYEDLRKFKTEYEKQQDQLKQKDLETQKNYEEAKKTYEGKINEYQGLVTKKDSEINDLKISYNLTNEIMQQGAYVEESLALIKSNAVLDKDGRVLIKSKDANGIDVNLPVAEGIKRFLEQRPHLVKATHRSGSGSGSGELPNQAGGAGQSSDLNSLNAEYLKAMNRGDLKATRELKSKINALLGSKGVSM